jgi:hypothetical protein
MMMYTLHTTRASDSAFWRTQANDGAALCSFALGATDGLHDASCARRQTLCSPNVGCSQRLYLSMQVKRGRSFCHGHRQCNRSAQFWGSPQRGPIHVQRSRHMSGPGRVSWLLSWHGGASVSGTTSSRRTSGYWSLRSSAAHRTAHAAAAHTTTAMSTTKATARIHPLCGLSGALLELTTGGSTGSS